MNPRPILGAAEMRAAEEAVIAAGTLVETLMERAGVGVAEAARLFSGGMPALILCGPGNNGGDGYVAARHLKAMGASVRVAALGCPSGGAAGAARSAWDGPIETLEEARPAPLLIDCLFGTGLTRPLAADVAGALARLAAGARLRVAVDLPSGVATDHGAILSPVPTFDMTIVPGALKPAHRLQPAAARCGRLVLVDIGLGPIPSLLTEISRPVLPAPRPDDHKYSRGMVAVVGGSMAGAALLAATAAQRAGAGYVMLAGGAGAGGPLALVHGAAPDAGALGRLVEDRRIGALVIGPGLGRDAQARACLEVALAAGRPLILDADALVLLAGDPGRLAALPTRPILTPHEGEFGQLFGEIAGSKIDRARVAAARSGAVVVLKGADTIVADADGRAAIGPPAPAWLASAGTGDVLAGIAGAMLARGLDSFDAACAAVWLHGEAAGRAGPGLIADDLAAQLPGLLGECA
ncbi:MAG: carbohydrate kinase, YjeF-like protein [Sphingomonas bacterium]|nr:carbohydrate kinase, YjeF-like protein [Sphingomonas bacterium]